jgi:hypothetical protein
MCGLANTLLSTIGIYRCYTLLVSFNNELMDIETEKETLLIAQDARGGSAEEWISICAEV